MPETIRFVPKELTDAAKTAISLEVEGYNLYVEAAGKSKNPLGKATLSAIAEKELLHKKAIEDFYARATGSEVLIAPGERKQYSEKIKTEILNAIKGPLEKAAVMEDAMMKAYEVSMEMEKKSYDFYKKIAETTGDPEAKGLFNFLAKEENIHFDILQDTYLYLNNPSEWFHKEEKWLVEG